jgi:hypothetical protein
VLEFRVKDNGQQVLPLLMEMEMAGQIYMSVTQEMLMEMTGGMNCL